MSKRTQFLTLFTTMLLVVGLFGQEKPNRLPIPRDLPVDRVLLEDGELRGLVFGVGPQGEIWFATRREWLHKAYPALASRLEKEQEDREWALRADYARRLAQWDKTLPATPDNEQLKGFIDQQLSRMDPGFGKDGPAGKGQFLLARLEPRFAKSMVRARPEHQKLVLVAWRERVENVETVSAAALSADLKKDSIAWEKENPDFIDKMPGMPVESEADWELRKAFLSYFHGKSLNFQGAVDAVFEVPEGGAKLGPGGLEQILGKLGPGLLDNALGGLLGENPKGDNGARAVDRASRVADQKGVRQFRLTRVDPDLVNRRVSVDDRVYARMGGPGGESWKLLHKREVVADATIARPQVEAQINKDPQAGPLLAQMRQLGFGEKLDEAVRFGAATLEAKDQADALFNTSMRLFTRRIDGPPIRWFLSPGGPAR